MSKETSGLGVKIPLESLILGNKDFFEKKGIFVEDLKKENLDKNFYEETFSDFLKDLKSKYEYCFSTYQNIKYLFVFLDRKSEMGRLFFNLRELADYMFEYNIYFPEPKGFDLLEDYLLSGTLLE